MSWPSGTVANSWKQSKQPTIAWPGLDSWGLKHRGVGLSEKFWQVCPRKSYSLFQLSRSVVSNSVTPWTTAHQASLSTTNSWSLLKLMSPESVIPSNHLTLCHPPLLLPSIFPSIKVFSNESVLHSRWPKYWNFSISLSNKYSGLISFRIDWFDHRLVQGTLQSLLQHHSSKASILQCSAFFMVQL